jgi:hypothetical protein
MLRIKALKAHEKAKEISAEKLDKERQKLTDKTRKQFIKIFEVEPDDVSENRVVCDGEVIIRDGNEWRLLGSCDSCGHTVQSHSFNDLVGLGAMMTKFRMDREHHSFTYCSILRNGLTSYR